MSVASRRRWTALVAGFAATLVLMTGCASSVHGSVDGAVPQPALSEIDALEDPRAYEGPSTALIPNVEIEPIAENPEQQLPSTVTSYTQTGDEEQIEITDTGRVVAVDLAGSIAATVWGLGFGETLVGVDQSTTFPGTEDLDRVTSGGHTVNAETIIGLAPDVVITDGTVGPRDVIEQLRDVGITVVFVDNDPSFQGAEELVRQVAGVYGAPEVGELLAERIGQEIDATIAEVADLVPDDEADRLRILFLYLRGNAGVYYLFGSESGADELISALGCVDVAGELGWEGMRPMTDEALVAADPDLILTMTGGIASVGGVDGLLQEKPAVALTTAGEKRRIVDMEDGAVLSFGPRSATVIDALARAIYAPDSTGSDGE
ncbi:Heme ABC transporter, cell surface heme and hemoprotein receptor HmuT [Microbacterium esteraromaticum]|uniref:Heme ABC transporter, cell surface heme and hemoprotein receptor HmuT n=1 Tax=Microbacterium esteraromaticum TaxID=57043 RepID=A0A1R4KNQ4_9MICO|nr:ABC transporter substrate-binding protein [Microbacterium esteraromaticum]SJN45723.1 Heme ABC transporter, cell surface heme and hemoprotein receptor HmuT [Microbacterium esteraromaticum]